MSKTIALVCRAKNCAEKAFRDYFKDRDVEIVKTDSLLEASECDLCVLDGYSGHLSQQMLECTQFLNIHYSLLPAFDCRNPVEEAFKTGVKVTGVTLSLLDDDGTKGRIIAQYPVFVDFFTTIDELEDELGKVVQKLAPFVAQSVLEDKVFSYAELLSNQGGCSGSCSGGCSCSDEQDRA